MAYGTNKGYIKKQAAKVNKKTKAKSDSSLYYKDKSGTVRFKSNNKEVASGRASTPIFDPIDVVGFGGSVAKNSAKLAGNIGINLSKKITKSDIINKAYAKTAGPLIASALSGGDNNKPAKKSQTTKKLTKKSKSK